MPDISDYDRQSVFDTAQRLKIDPRTLAAVIAYETGGTFDPRSVGPSGKGYPVRGLIGFDPENVRRYGFPASTIAAQMPQVEQYLLDRGWKPGAYKPTDLARLYSIINAGSLDAAGNPRLGARDINDDISGHVRKIQSGYFSAADRFLKPISNQEDLSAEWVTPKPGVAVVVSKPGAGTASPEEDLSSEWVTSPSATPESPAKAPAPTVSPVPVAAAVPDHETLPQAVNRLTHEHPESDLFSLSGLRDTAIRAGAGAIRGVGDVADTAAQGIAAGVGGTADYLARHNYISPETAKRIGDWRAGVNADIAANNRGYESAGPGAAGNLSRIAGEIATTAPILGLGGRTLEALPGGARIASGMAQHPFASSFATGAALGAGTNALTSARDETPLSDQIKWGAGIGGVLGPVGYGLGRMVARGVDQETADLAQTAIQKYGIPLRADQISGNEMVRRAGGLLQKTPFSGLAANAEQQQAGFNRALASEMGESADKITPYVMQNAKDRIGGEFDRLLPQFEGYLSQNARGTGTADRLQAVADSTLDMTDEEARLVMRRVNDVVKTFTGVSAVPGKAGLQRGVARASGEDIQSLITKGSPLDRALSAQSSNVRYAAQELKDTLLDSVGLTPTGQAKRAAAYVANLNDFKRARYQWKALKTIEPLAADSTTGDVSPAKLASKLSGNDMLYRGGNLAELARIGQRFLKPPGSSGTAEHLLLMQALGGALGYGGGKLADPEHAQEYAITGLIAPALATRTLGGAIASRMAARAALRSSLRGTPSAAAGVLASGVPALAPRSNPLVLTVHPDSPTP